MHSFRSWFLVAGSVLAAACGVDPISGSGTIRTEPRPVSGFSAVSLSGSGQLLIEQTGTEALTVTADDNLLTYITTEVRGNRLEIGVKDPTINIRPTDDIVYRLTVRELEEVDVSGSGKVDVKGLNPNQLAIRISGSGVVVAQGAANEFDLHISGSGSYEGARMRSKRATAAISGSGSALIAADETLSAEVSGSGSIEYIGDPQVDDRVSGSGSVRRR